MRARVDALLAGARRRLAGAPRERLGDWAHTRRLLGFGRAPRIVPVGEAWHVGVLLIGDAEVWATGEVLGALPIDVDEVARGGVSGPLSLIAGVVHVRWSPTGVTRPLADYLDEQLELLGR